LKVDCFLISTEGQRWVDLGCGAGGDASRARAAKQHWDADQQAKIDGTDLKRIGEFAGSAPKVSLTWRTPPEIQRLFRPRRERFLRAAPDKPIPP